VGVVAAGAQGADAEPEQVRGAGVAHDVERDRRRREQRRQAERSGGDVHERARLDPQGRGDARPPALAHAPGDQVHEVRPRDRDEGERGGGEHEDRRELGHRRRSWQRGRGSASGRAGTGGPMRISARNQLTGTVVSVNRGAAIANVTVDVGGQRLVSSITVEALDDLGLAEGGEVVALVKASDVLLAVPD
jgi:molybdopterin-binding protein